LSQVKIFPREAFHIKKEILNEAGDFQMMCERISLFAHGVKDNVCAFVLPNRHKFVRYQAMKLGVLLRL